MSYANEPAKPCRATINRDSGELQPFQFGNNDFECLGLTRREEFAKTAMHGLLSFYGDGQDWELTAREAVACADALLAELEAQS
jgi:hypothetical protein